MEGNRIRGERAAAKHAVACARAAALAFTFVLVGGSGLVLPEPVAAATQVRTLFLAEQVRPHAVRPALAGTIQPHQMVAQPGEEEGFILAVRPASTVRLQADVDASSSAFARRWTQLLRSEWVTVTRPSTGMGSSPGRYADPLPPQVPGAGDAGRLLARAGEWSSFVVLVSVPSDTPAGTHVGTVVVRSSAGQVVASVPFSITVVTTRMASGAADPAIAPHDPRTFRMLFNFSPSWYRRLAPARTAQEQYEQGYRTLWMLARHRAASNAWQKAYPTSDGTYGCGAADGYLKVFGEMPWWADGRPGAQSVALMPNHAVARCGKGSFTIRDEADRSTKFDDRVGDVVQSAWFIYRMADHWRTRRIQDHRTYFLNPFDEPDARQAATSMAQVNRLVHDYAPGVKVLGTTWPMERRDRQACRTVAGTRHCARHRGQPAGNGMLRDGGSDDLDGWVVPHFRMFGFGVTPAQQRAGIDRRREVADRLRSIRRAGGEAWSYDLPLGTRRVPQLAIDGPAADSRVMFWPLAREGMHGWYIAVSNRWVDPVATSRVRNPWDAPLSWVGSRTGQGGTGPHAAASNGWGSLYYPPVRPALGLTDPLAQPVSSLRLERMRDGVEDANLMRQYRDRFGQRALERLTAGVLGPLRAGTDLPGNEAYPHLNRRGLALRMELVRRQMLAQLAQ